MKPIPKLLSKSKIMRGYRCLKSIYYTIHRPELAAEVGLVPLSAFGDGRAPPEDFDGEPEEFFEQLGPSTDWYDAAEGRAAVLTLVAALESEPGYVEALGDGLGDAVVEELRALAEVLAAAAAAKSRFRIDLG